MEVPNFIERLNKAQLTMLSFAQTVDWGQDHYSGPHCERVAALGVALAGQLGLSHDDQFGLYCGGYLHDIGKIAIPDAIRFKSGKLNAAEFRVMQTHTVIGHDICRAIPAFARSLPIVRHHHERWDGSGYPDRLAGDAIPLLARIFQVVDIYDALTTARQYRRNLPHEDAIGAMTEQGCSDSLMVRAFAELPVAAHQRAISALPRLPVFHETGGDEKRLSSEKAVEFYSCFISHSTNDAAIAERINEDLRINGIKSWYAPEDLKIGDVFRWQIDESIRLHDKLLLILSSSSVASSWVESEVEAALEEERRRSQELPEALRGSTTVLFPIRIDDSIFGVQSGWAANVRRTRHIGDFRDWQNSTSYYTALRRLLRDLAASDEADAQARKARRLAAARLRGNATSAAE